MYPRLLYNLSNSRRLASRWLEPRASMSVALRSVLTNSSQVTLMDIKVRTDLENIHQANRLHFKGKVRMLLLKDYLCSRPFEINIRKLIVGMNIVVIFTCERLCHMFKGSHLTSFEHSSDKIATCTNQNSSVLARKIYRVMWFSPNKYNAIGMY